MKEYPSVPDGTAFSPKTPNPFVCFADISPIRGITSVLSYDKKKGAFGGRGFADCSADTSLSTGNNLYKKKRALKATEPYFNSKTSLNITAPLCKGSCPVRD